MAARKDGDPSRSARALKRLAILDYMMLYYIIYIYHIISYKYYYAIQDDFLLTLYQSLFEAWKGVKGAKTMANQLFRKPWLEVSGPDLSEVRTRRHGEGRTELALSHISRVRGLGRICRVVL